MSLGVQWTYSVNTWPLGPAVRLYSLKQSFGLKLLVVHLVLPPLALEGALHSWEEGAFHLALLCGLLDHRAWLDGTGSTGPKALAWVRGLGSTILKEREAGLDHGSQGA